MYARRSYAEAKAEGFTVPVRECRHVDNGDVIDTDTSPRVLAHFCPLCGDYQVE